MTGRGVRGIGESKARWVRRRWRRLLRSAPPPAWDAEEVGRLRLRLGLTQTELARRLGVVSSTVNGWEQSRSRPRAVAEHALDQLWWQSIDGRGRFPHRGKR